MEAKGKEDAKGSDLRKPRLPLAIRCDALWDAATRNPSLNMEKTRQIIRFGASTVSPPTTNASRQRYSTAGFALCAGVGGSSLVVLALTSIFPTTSARCLWISSRRSGSGRCSTSIRGQDGERDIKWSRHWLHHSETYDRNKRLVYVISAPATPRLDARTFGDDPIRAGRRAIWISEAGAPVPRSFA